MQLMHHLVELQLLDVALFTRKKWTRKSPVKRIIYAPAENIQEELPVVSNRTELLSTGRPRGSRYSA